MHAHLQFVIYTRDNVDNFYQKLVSPTVLSNQHLSRDVRKPTMCFEQGRHKLACTVTEAG